MNDNKIIGRTSATDRDPNTADKFNFWITGNEIINPFDIVEAEHFKNSKTYGLVAALEHRTDAASHLANYVSNNFGSISCSYNLTVSSQFISLRLRFFYKLNE